MNTKGSLAPRLLRAITVQTVLITLAAVLGVFFTTVMLEDVLIKQALQREAAHFWDSRAADADFPLPDTANLSGYLSEGHRTQLPARLRNLPTGFHETSSDGLVSVAYVTERGGERLLLLFDATQAGELATYFGLVPLAAVLVLLYSSMWIAYRISHRLFSPVTWLAHKVNELDPQTPDVTAFKAENLPRDADQEVHVLARAISEFAERLEAFVARERNFTRDASHELRSPLTVIRIATEMLLSEQELEPKVKGSVLRIRRAVQDMEELTEAFLILARESEKGLSQQPVCLNNLIEEELERAQPLLEGKTLSVRTHARCQLVTRGSDKVLAVLLGNLLRNAVIYTESGSIDIHIGNREISIEDSGVGISEQEIEQVFEAFYRGNGGAQSGHGVGLTIVKRLSDRFGWPISFDSAVGVGTRVTVAFPDSHCEPLPRATVPPSRPGIPTG